MTANRTLDDEYRARNLIRPSQFRKIHAKNRDQFETVSFDWKGTKVHGFRPPRTVTNNVGQTIAVNLTPDEVRDLRNAGVQL
jgi:hypothetical protein